MSNPGAVGSFQRLTQPRDDRVELLCQIVVGVHGQVGLGVFDLVDVEGALGGRQVWSLTQFYSVYFSKSRIGVKKCVFNKRSIKVCVSCC